MSDLERLLESVAEEIRVKLINELSMDRHVSELDKDAAVVLKRRLLPLLNAGQAMRDDYGQTLEADPCEAWDVAKHKALEI